jgi:TrpR-related protein YerC/YecD
MMDEIKDNHFTESELEELTDLYNAMLTMRDSAEMHKFLKDLCSINELHSFIHRWQIVRRIEQGKSYEEIIKELSPAEAADEASDEDKSSQGSKKTTGRARGKARTSTKVSSTTISRVKKCLVNPEGGYRTALNRLNEASGDKDDIKNETK